MAIEIENVYTAKMKNTNELNKAKTRTRIEQWEVASAGKNPNGGIIRVRSYDRKRYEMTVKNFNAGKTGCGEVNTKIDKETFDAFKALAPIGFVKWRFTFPAGNGLVWEFDVFKDKDGEFIPWVKIDLELTNAQTTPPEFPVELEKVFERRKGNEHVKHSEEDEAFLDRLGKRFVSVNKTNLLPIKERI